MTGMVFTFVLLLVNGLRELLPLMGLVTLAQGIQAFALLIPFLFSFALPMGMLTAALLVFGRFSADQELTAARAGGVSLVSLVAPVLLLSLLLCAFSAAVNLEIAPRCRVAYVELRDKLRGGAISRYQLPEGKYIKTFPGCIISVGKNRNRELEQVLIWSFENETNLVQSIRAPRGRFEVDTTNQQALLHLFDATVDPISSDSAASLGKFSLAFDLNPTNRSARKISIGDMTFRQLRAELRRLESATGASLPPGKFSDEELKKKKLDLQKAAKELAEPVRVQLHRQVAFSFACFGFTLVGIPLGIRVHRRETNIGFAIALGLVLVYYALLIVGDSLNTRPELAPHLLMWAPNFLFQGVGAVLLWRANRGV